MDHQPHRPKIAFMSNFTPIRREPRQTSLTQTLVIYKCINRSQRDIRITCPLGPSWHLGSLFEKKLPICDILRTNLTTQEKKAL